MPIKKKVVKKVKGKGKSSKGKGKKPVAGTSFSTTELSKFMNTIKKMRKNKRGKKGKKVGLTNVSSFLNLLHNAERARQKQPKRNLMKAHPFKYPSLIQDADVDNIWNATKLPKAKTHVAMVKNLNNIYRQLAGFELLKSLRDKKDEDKMPGKKLAPHLRGAVRAVGPDGGSKSERAKGPYLSSRPSKEPAPREARSTLPSKPSRAPPIQDSSSDDESSSDF